jgi:hypothetical protein
MFIHVRCVAWCVWGWTCVPNLPNVNQSIYVCMRIFMWMSVYLLCPPPPFPYSLIYERTHHAASAGESTAVYQVTKLSTNKHSVSNPTTIISLDRQEIVFSLYGVIRVLWETVTTRVLCANSTGHHSPSLLFPRFSWSWVTGRWLWLITNRILPGIIFYSRFFLHNYSHKSRFNVGMLRHNLSHKSRSTSSILRPIRHQSTHIAKQSEAIPGGLWSKVFLAARRRAKRPRRCWMRPDLRCLWPIPSLPLPSPRGPWSSQIGCRRPWPRPALHSA